MHLRWSMHWSPELWVRWTGVHRSAAALERDNDPVCPPLCVSTIACSLSSIGAVIYLYGFDYLSCVEISRCKCVDERAYTPSTILVVVYRDQNHTAWVLIPPRRIWRWPWFTETWKSWSGLLDRMAAVLTHAYIMHENIEQWYKSCSVRIQIVRH